MLSKMLVLATVLVCTGNKFSQSTLYSTLLGRKEGVCM